MTRIRRGWRQVDLAEAAGVSRATVSRVEAGHLATFSLATLRKVCAQLEVSMTVDVRGRGGDLDRMLSLRHSRLHESVLRTLSREYSGWSFNSEVSFNVWGERGVIDLVLWHADARAMLLVELKTELVDVNELLGTMDRRRRLASNIAQDRAWQPATVSTWIVIAASRTNQRRVAEHRTLLTSAYPAGARAMRAWLTRPAGSIAGLSMWSVDTRTGPRIAPARRVRRPAP
jgi:DNA-binding Xre family transcriptional regulator